MKHSCCYPTPPHERSCCWMNAAGIRFGTRQFFHPTIKQTGTQTNPITTTPPDDDDDMPPTDGDLKYSLQLFDHSSWLLLNGRSVVTLSQTILDKCRLLGLTETTEGGFEILLNCQTGCYLRGKKPEEDISSIAGSNDILLAPENLPTKAFAINTQTEGDHTHATTIQEDAGHSHTVTNDAAGNHQHYVVRGRQLGDASTKAYPARGLSWAITAASTGTTASRYELLATNNSAAAPADSCGTSLTGSHTHTTTVSTDGTHGHLADVALDGAHTHAVDFNLNDGTQAPIEITPRSLACNIFVWVSATA
jgi:hypothetical protein